MTARVSWHQLDATQAWRRCRVCGGKGAAEASYGPDYLTSLCVRCVRAAYWAIHVHEWQPDSLGFYRVTCTARRKRRQSPRRADGSTVARVSEPVRPLRGKAKRTKICARHSWVKGVCRRCGVQRLKRAKVRR